MEDRFELRPRQGDLPAFRRMILSKLLHLFSGFYTGHEVVWKDSDEEREGVLWRVSVLTVEDGSSFRFKDSLPLINFFQ